MNFAPTRKRPFLYRQLLDLAIGLSITLAIFALVELYLKFSSSDQVPLRAPLHLSAGFDLEADNFEPDANNPGGWRGRFTHKNGDVLVIPSKGEALRVLMFGGSNTASFSHHHLKACLEERLGQAVEVINLGRAGFGSTRVAILFREALEKFQPDALVLYSGHNEFVERSFALDLASNDSNAWQTKLVASFESTAWGQLLSERARQDTKPTSKYSNLNEWETEYSKFKGQTWEETLAIWDAYEENLRYMCSLAQQRELPMLMSTVIWNRFSAPRVASPPPQASREQIKAARHSHARAYMQYPLPLRRLTPRGQQDRIHNFDWCKNREPLPEGTTQAALPGLRPSTDFLANQSAEKPFHLDWDPKVRQWFEDLAWLNSKKDAEQTAALKSAKEAVRLTLEMQPTNAELLYELSMLDYALGQRGAGIRKRFEEAARLDRAPRKGTPLSNERVHKVAAEFPEHAFLDADTLFANANQDGLVGWEWMIDHCHLGRGGARALLDHWAQALADHLMKKSSAQ